MSKCCSNILQAIHRNSPNALGIAPCMVPDIVLENDYNSLILIPTINTSFFNYKINFAISQHAHKNSRGYFVVKTGFKAVFKDIGHPITNQTQIWYDETK